MTARRPDWPSSHYCGIHVICAGLRVSHVPCHLAPPAGRSQHVAAAAVISTLRRLEYAVEKSRMLEYQLLFRVVNVDGRHDDVHSQGNKLGRDFHPTRTDELPATRLWMNPEFSPWKHATAFSKRRECDSRHEPPLSLLPFPLLVEQRHVCPTAVSNDSQLQTLHPASRP